MYPDDLRTGSQSSAYSAGASQGRSGGSETNRNERPVQLFNEASWESQNDVSLSGFLYYRGTHIQIDELDRLLRGVRTIEHLRTILSDCTGPFSVVVERGDRVLAAAGPAPTSTCLFYSRTESGYITDRYQWLQAQHQVKPYAEDIAMEVLLSGRIHGAQTLHPDIYQLQPGEIVSIPTSGSDNWKSTQYYTPTRHPNIITDRQQLLETLKETLDGIFDRLKQAAEGRPILLALSGGYDSRLIALMLHRHGFENVYAYTLNTQSDFDLDIAEQIADRLGFEWVGFEYSQSDLREMYESSFWHRINEKFGVHGTAEPHPTTALTLKNIIDHPELPTHGIKVAGDSPADAVGNYLPESILDSSSVKRETVMQILIDHYFGNKTLYSDTRKKVADIITDLVDVPAEVETPTAIAILSRWHWLNQASRMRHRLFQNVGFDTFWPYNEKEFYEFLPRLPVEEQFDRSLLEQYTEQLNESHLNGFRIGLDRDRSVDYKKKIKEKLERTIINSPIEDPVKRLRYDQLRYSTDYRAVYESTLKFGYMSFDRFERNYTGREHYAYFLGKDELSRSQLRPDGTDVVPAPLQE